MKKIVKKLKSIFKILRYKIFKKIKLPLSIKLNEQTYLEGGNVIHKNVNIINSYIGFGTYIGENSKISRTKIGRYTCIASDVKVILGSHPTKDFVSIHPAFYSTKKQSGFTFVDKNKYNELETLSDDYCIEIGNDVWIGANVLIMEGVKIGDGAIIGAGAIVTKNIEPYTINIGCPTKIYSKRFTEEEIAFLKKFQWWNRDFSWIKQNCELFESIDKFIKENKNNE